MKKIILISIITVLFCSCKKDSKTTVDPIPTAKEFSMLGVWVSAGDAHIISYDSKGNKIYDVKVGANKTVTTGSTMLTFYFTQLNYTSDSTYTDVPTTEYKYKIISREGQKITIESHKVGSPDKFTAVFTIKSKDTAERFLSRKQSDGGYSTTTWMLRKKEAKPY